MSDSLESLMQRAEAQAPARLAVLQLASFVGVGGIAAGCFVALSSVAIGLHTGIPDWMVSALCYAVFIVPVYLSHRRFSFRSDAPHARALPRYVLVQLSGLMLAALFSFVAYHVFALPAVAAGVLVIGLTSGVNFIILRLWAFAESKQGAWHGQLGFKTRP